jgi:hypothetical protein
MGGTWTLYVQWVYPLKRTHFINQGYCSSLCIIPVEFVSYSFDTLTFIHNSIMLQFTALLRLYINNYLFANFVTVIKNSANCEFDFRENCIRRKIVLFLIFLSKSEQKRLLKLPLRTLVPVWFSSQQNYSRKKHTNIQYLSFYYRTNELQVPWTFM